LKKQDQPLSLMLLMKKIDLPITNNITNKQDYLCRLLHLFVEPSAQAAWRRAHRPLTRVELD
jgi:hypothetical protein